MEIPIGLAYSFTIDVLTVCLFHMPACARIEKGNKVLCLLFLTYIEGIKKVFLCFVLACFITVSPVMYPFECLHDVLQYWKL